MKSGKEGAARVFRKGELYWIPSPEQGSGGKGIAHPHVILQETVLNQSRIPTIVVCALSTNLKRVSESGNVLLDKGEGGLEKQSLVVVSQVSAVDRRVIGAFIGALSPERIDAIFAGMRFQQNLAAR